MPPLSVAQSDPAMIGLLVQSLTALLLLIVAGMQVFGRASGRDTQRKVEPTEMHGVITELRSQTATLNKLDREMGGMTAKITAVDEKIDAQAQQVDNAFKRINAISIESAAVKARVEGIEQREGNRRA